MNFQEVLQKSKGHMGPWCKSCPICNGKACTNHIPGPGAKGTGTVAIRNYDAWQEVFVKMDTISETNKVDTTFELFGKTFKYPIFAGPVGAVDMHYSDELNDTAYNDLLVRHAKEAGIAAFTGDGMDDQIMISATRSIKENEGVGIATIKPWPLEIVKEKLDLVKQSGAFAFAMDIDAAGLPFLRSFVPPAGRKSVEELRQIKEESNLPFIIKGIMSVEGAKKAMLAGADAIVVSNHGGRVQDGTPSTAFVLPEIADAVQGKMKIFVDGGIRSGTDVFKALALGADGVLIARPFVNAVYGDHEEGVGVLVRELGNELEETMRMCGASDLSSISRSMVETPNR